MLKDKVRNAFAVRRSHQRLELLGARLEFESGPHGAQIFTLSLLLFQFRFQAAGDPHDILGDECYDVVLEHVSKDIRLGAVLTALVSPYDELDVGQFVHVGNVRAEIGDFLLLDGILDPRGVESGAEVVGSDDGLSHNIVDVVVLAPCRFLHLSIGSANGPHVQDMCLTRAVRTLTTLSLWQFLKGMSCSATTL